MKLTKMFRTASLSGALLLFVLTASQAQTTATWIGPASGGEWNTGANWDTTAPPLDSTTNAIIGVGTNVNYNLPMDAAAFGVLTNNGVVNVNTNGFNNSGIYMLNPGGTGKLFVNTGGVVNITGNLGFCSNSVVYLSAESSVTISGGLNIGSGATGGTGTGTAGALGVMTNDGGYLSAAATSLNPANGSVGNNTANLFVINGGTNNLGDVFVGRASGSSLVPLGREGLVINGGFVSMTSLLIGNNSWGAMLIGPGATVTNSGDGRLKMNGTTGRPSRLFQSGGLFFTAGINYVSPSNNASAPAAFSVTGGTNYSGGFQFGEGPNIGIANFTNAAVIYVGSSGIASNGAITVNAALNDRGLFGATADWTGSAPMILNGVNSVFTFQTADADGTPHDITLTGGLRGSGSLNKTGGGTLHLGATNTYSGSTLINAATLAIDASGSLASPLIIVGSGAVFDVSAVSGGFVLNAGQTLSGSGSVNGTVTTAPTTGVPAPVINPGSNALTGTLTFQNDVVEQGGAINHFDLSGNPSGPDNDFAVITGSLTVTATNIIETGGAPTNGGVYKLIQYGTFSGDLTNITTLSGTLSNSVANKIIYLIAQSSSHPPTNVTWLGNPVANDWDTLATKNWSINGTGPATNFVPGDNARFDNIGAVNPLVNVVDGVAPGSVTVDSTSGYTFTGNGSISGTGGLTKTNSGRLTILTTNAYTGVTAIEGGILTVSYLANGSSPSAIGAANLDPANLVLSNGVLNYAGPSVTIDRGITFATNFGGTLDITNGTTLTDSGTLNGSGSVIKAGPGTLSLTGNSTYTGSTVLSNGTLLVNGPATIGAGTVAFEGGTLSIASSSSQQFYNNTLNVDSGGTLIYNGGNANNVIQGDWTGAGTLNLNIASSSGNCTLNGNLTGFTGTILLTANSAGTFRFNSGGNSSGAQQCVGSPSATFDLGQSTAALVNRNGGGSNFGTYYLGALAGGPGTYVRGSASSGSPCTYQIGDKNLSTTFSGTIQDGYAGQSTPQVAAAVSIVKTGTGTLTLNGSTNNFSITVNDDGSITTNYFPGNGLVYTGSTIISNGVLALVVPAALTNSPNVVLATSNAVLDVSQMGYLDINTNLVTNGVCEVIAGQNFGGQGTVRGQVLADAGSIFNVGWPLGSLTVTNGIELAGAVNMNINPAAAPNSSELVAPTITIDGTATLTVSNLGPEAGATFKLFSKPVTGFTIGVNFTPPPPTGTNSWVNNLAVDGSITLLAPPLVTVNTNVTSITNTFDGSNLTLTWPQDHIGWRLQAQTNALSTGLGTNWVDVAGANQTNLVVIPVSRTNATVFYRLIYQ